MNIAHSNLFLNGGTRKRNRLLICRRKTCRGGAYLRSQYACIAQRRERSFHKRKIMVRFHVQAPNRFRPCSLTVEHPAYTRHCLQIREQSRFESWRGHQISKAVEVRHGAPNGLLTLLAKRIRTDSIMVNAFCS